MSGPSLEAIGESIRGRRGAPGVGDWARVPCRHPGPRRDRVWSAGPIAGDGRSSSGRRRGRLLMDDLGRVYSYGIRRPSVAIATEMTASEWAPAMRDGA